MLKKIKPVYYFIIIFFLCLLYAYTISNDRLPLEYFKIFDTKNYVEIIKNFPRHFYAKDFTPYYNSRLLIPGLIHYIFRILHIDHSLINIQIFFLVLNFASICIGLHYFIKILRIKNYSETTTILAFSFIFVNFFILKFSSYYPVLMDIFGFTSGIILYYLYISKNSLRLFIFLAVSMFIFPTTILISLSLILSSIINFNKKEVSRRQHVNKLFYFILFFIIIYFTFFCYYYYSSLNNTAADLGVQLSTGLIPLTLTLLFIFIFSFLKDFLLVFEDISINIKGFYSFRLILPLLIIIIYFIASKYLSQNFYEQNTLSPTQFAYNIIFQAISFPLKFLITHFIYYGCFVIFLLIFYKDFFLHVRQNTDAFLKILIGMFILLSFGTESRQFLQILPFIIFIFLDAIKKYNFNMKLLIGLFLFQLIWSRVWYTINTADGFLGERPLDLNLLDYPAQKYFQFQGPWLSTENSLVYGIIFILVYLILSKLIKSNFKKLSI